jgi:hypothetical protein
MDFGLNEAEKTTFDLALKAWNARGSIMGGIAASDFLSLAEKTAKGLIQALPPDILHAMKAWHGFGVDPRPLSKRLLLFTDSKDSINPLKKFAESFGRVLPVDVLQIPRFRFCGSPAQPTDTAQPEVSIFATNKNCKKQDHIAGSMGAFLKFSDAQKGDPTFLLSACHVLDRDCTKTTPVDSTPDVHLDNDSEAVISSKVHAVPITSTGNRVDAAVAELGDVGLAKTLMAEILKGITVTSATPASQPLEPCSLVEKLGGKTGKTTGRVVTMCSKIAIDPSADIGGAEFDDQMMIVSQDDAPFVDEGDSGGLVVSNGAPAGIVIAKSHRAVIPGQPSGAPGGADGRYALASPFDVVLQELQKVLGNRSLQMIL